MKLKLYYEVIALNELLVLAYFWLNHKRKWRRFSRIWKRKL